MKFTFEPFWEPRPGQLELLFAKPITLDFPTANEARRAFSQILGHTDFPAHSMLLTSADGVVSERWYSLDGEWRIKEV